MSNLPLVLSGFPSCTLKLYYELPTQSWFLFLHYELICLSWNFLPYLYISYNETCYFLYFHGHIIILMYIILVRITSNLSIQFTCVFVSKVHPLEIEYSCPHHKCDNSSFPLEFKSIILLFYSHVYFHLFLYFLSFASSLRLIKNF